MASLECAEVLKVLLKKDNALTNRLLVVDLADYTLKPSSFPESIRIDGIISMNHSRPVS
jgi:hypothetical protein